MIVCCLQQVVGCHLPTQILAVVVRMVMVVAQLETVVGQVVTDVAHVAMDVEHVAMDVAQVVMDVAQVVMDILSVVACGSHEVVEVEDGIQHVVAPSFCVVLVQV